MSEISHSVPRNGEPALFLTILSLPPIFIGFLIPLTRIFFDTDEKHPRLDQATSLPIHNFLSCFVFLFGLDLYAARWNSNRGCKLCRSALYYF